MIFTHQALLCLEYIMYLELARSNAWKMAGPLFNTEVSMETQETIFQETGLIMLKDLELRVNSKFSFINYLSFI